jgi:hypothetical protein
MVLMAALLTARLMLGGNVIKNPKHAKLCAVMEWWQSLVVPVSLQRTVMMRTHPTRMGVMLSAKLKLAGVAKGQVLKVAPQYVVMASLQVPNSVMIRILMLGMDVMQAVLWRMVGNVENLAMPVKQCVVTVSSFTQQSNAMITILRHKMAAMHNAKWRKAGSVLPRGKPVAQSAVIQSKCQVNSAMMAMCSTMMAALLSAQLR